MSTSQSREAVESVAVRPPTADQPHLKVIGKFDVRVCPVAGYTMVPIVNMPGAGASVTPYHVGGLVLEDKSEIVESDAVALIDAGRVLYMIPPAGMHPASQALGAERLLLQVRTCEHCGQRVLFA